MLRANLPRADSDSLHKRSDTQRKLVRNARVELEIVDFDGTVQKITALAKESGGYIASQQLRRSRPTANCRARVVVKVFA